MKSPKFVWWWTDSLCVCKHQLLAASGDGTLAAYDLRKGTLRVQSETMHSELLSIAHTAKYYNE